MASDKLEQSLFPMPRSEALPDNAFRIGMAFENRFFVEDKGHAAGHAGTEILANAAEYHRDAAGHIFAAIGPATFDHHIRA